MDDETKHWKDYVTKTMKLLVGSETDSLIINGDNWKMLEISVPVCFFALLVTGQRNPEGKKNYFFYLLGFNKYILHQGDVLTAQL